MKTEAHSQEQSIEGSRLHEYEAAMAGPFLYLPDDPGYLQIGGPDREAFLQRQTTNDLKTLSPGRALVTVLTSPAARILDVLTLILTGSKDSQEELIGAVTLAGRAVRTYNYLRGRIFFMDKVDLADASSELLQVDISGPGARAIIQNFVQPPAVDEACTGNLGDSPLTVIGVRGLSGDDYRILASRGSTADLLSRLDQLGAILITEPVYEVLRIEAGRAGPVMELTEDFTPLETSLRYAISDNKGCYTGQEVIARQITYDKVTQQLAGIRLSEPVAAGEVIWAGGKKAGLITSIALSPRYGPIALGLIRRPDHTPGTSLEIGEKDARVTGQVVELPFR